jgi:tetratricopeptide (TPR) repeat protein
MRALMQGRLDDAAALRAEAEAIGEAAHSDNARMLTLTQELLSLVARGKPEEAYGRYVDLIVEWQGLLFMARPGLAFAAARCGRVHEARDLLAQVDLHDEARWGAEWLPAVSMTGEAAAYLGDNERALQVYDALLPYRHLFAIDGIAAANYGSIERPLGMLAACLGRQNDARAHFDAALRAHERVGAPQLIALTEADAAHFLDAPAPVPSPTRAGAFIREGDMWAVTYEGRTVRVRHTKGIADIARLLSEPGRELHALDLASPGPAPAGGDTGPAIDTAARDAYKQRLIDLDAELEVADAAADFARSERLAAERDALLAQLSGAYGLGGRARKTGDPAERARSAVTQRVRDALGRIDREHTELGAHLRRAVRTGLFCVYEPDGPVDWNVSLA